MEQNLLELGYKHLAVEQYQVVEKNLVEEMFQRILDHRPSQNRNFQVLHLDRKPSRFLFIPLNHRLPTLLETANWMEKFDLSTLFTNDRRKKI